MADSLLEWVLDEKTVRMKNPLSLAYIGDTVWDLLVRQKLLTGNTHVNALHKTAVNFVNAGAQAEAAALIETMLTEKEADVFKRGCNAHAHHAPPKNQHPYDYSRATGLESLMGYLYLTGQFSRILELFDRTVTME